MSKLIVMKGLPASGKSTLAKRIVKDAPKTARVNRDDLRAMMFDGVWSAEREKLVVAIEKAVVGILSNNSYDAIVDDTNLATKNEKMWEDVAKELNMTHVLNTFTIPVEECVRRDMLRTGSSYIGAPIIHRMALENHLYAWPEDRKKVVFVDIDGTIADESHRNHLLNTPEGSKKNWDAYFEAMMHDTPIMHIINWVNELSKDYVIVLATGRSDNYKQQTITWLKMLAKVNYDLILMRRGSDFRPDYVVKEEMLNLVGKDRVAFAIEDRASVVNRTWRKNGIMVIPVQGELEE